MCEEEKKSDLEASLRDYIDVHFEDALWNNKAEWARVIMEQLEDHIETKSQNWDSWIEELKKCHKEAVTLMFTQISHTIKARNDEANSLVVTMEKFDDQIVKLEKRWLDLVDPSPRT